METSTAKRPTVTQREQWMVERQVFEIYNIFMGLPHNPQAVMLEVRRDEHIEYLYKGLRELGPAFVVLDANRPWICYWILHSIAMLGESLDAKLEENVIDFLGRCQHPDGGFGGGPGQLPHLATTYAAVNSLITLGGQRSLLSINRGKLYTFLLRMKHASGGFRMHDGGEIDVRACYTAISVASILNILDSELVQNVGSYILSCQTFEGGIAGEPGSEAHGGYTFCGLATMILINEVTRLDLPSLIGGVCALIQRLHSIIQQLEPSNSEEEYYSTDSESSADLKGNLSHVNDTCPLRHKVHEGQNNVCCPVNFFDIGLNFIREHAELEPFFNSTALQQYILLCSQVDSGFRDKPGKHKDYYHTCYCLSGLSVCQYSSSKKAGSQPLPRTLLGPFNNLLQPVHPIFNVVLERFNEAHEFFSRT